MATPANEDEMRVKIRDMITEIGTSMFVTVDEDGSLRSRPMRLQAVDPDGVTLWFFSPTGSEKNDQIGHDGRVLLGFSNPSSQDYVSLSGQAQVVNDKAKQKQLWTESLRVWFPGGPESPNVALIAVKVEGAEYWDVPSSAMVHAYGYVKALVTGRPPHPGDVGKVAFSH
jgi:general stress protein 26